MNIKEIIGSINGKVICCPEKLSSNIDYAFASDLMSDVLTVEKEDMILITGLSNLQTIRTAEMSEISFIIIARDKKSSTDMISLAEENNIMLIESPFSLFHISGKLYNAGVKSIY